MTTRPLGMMPEHTYEPSYCNQALEAAGLPLTPPPTGVTYTSDEIARIARSYRIGSYRLAQRRNAARQVVMRGRRTRGRAMD